MVFSPNRISSGSLPRIRLAMDDCLPRSPMSFARGPLFTRHAAAPCGVLGSLDSVKVLVHAGANVDQQDSAWHGTPLGWAEHYVETSDSDRKARYAEIAAYLRDDTVIHPTSRARRDTTRRA